MASVKVAVRVRPFNQREKDMEAELIIQMRGKTTGILNCKANTRDESIRYKEFTFDHSYWSHEEKSNNYASQETVYNDLGTEVVDCAFEGYNACVFAYGQTGSGKTFTMMGSPDNQGLIPRICKALFDRMSENSKRGTTHRVQVSYLEIYQERVADLLIDRRDKENSSLKVREHPKKGPYVQGLTTCWVTNYGHIQDCMNRCYHLPYEEVSSWPTVNRPERLEPPMTNSLPAQEYPDIHNRVWQDQKYFTINKE